jgi:hypothetical protein
MQPFINLAQANMALLAKYASPEVMTQAMNQVQAAMKQGSGAQIPMPQSATAFAELAQGMMENYARFMNEIAQSGMALWTQGQSALVQQMQDVAGAAGQGGRSKRST